MRIISNPFISGMSGKVFSGLCDWWATTRYGKTYSAHKNKGRDYKEHPVTEEERKTRERLKRASQAFNEWQPTDDELVAFDEAYQRQLKESKNPKNTIRGYFIHLRMEEMKREGELKADKSQNMADWQGRMSRSRRLNLQAQNLIKKRKKASTPSSASDSCRA